MISPAGRQPHESSRADSRLASAIERSIFFSRWLLAPMYLGLAASLLLLLFKFAQQTVNLASHAVSDDVSNVITGILTLIDLSLMGNLLVMVMLSGYENFVSRFGNIMKGRRPDWLGTVSFGALKHKLMTSIIAIAAVHILELFMHVSEINDRDLGWSVGILFTFVVSGLLLALMERLGEGGTH